MRRRDVIAALVVGAPAGWLLAPYVTGWRGQAILGVIVLVVTAIAAHRIISVVREPRGPADG